MFPRVLRYKRRTDIKEFDVIKFRVYNIAKKIPKPIEEWMKLCILECKNTIILVKIQKCKNMVCFITPMIVTISFS